MHSMLIYSVQTGDTLESIARGIKLAAGVSTAHIMQANALLCVQPPGYLLPKDVLIMVPVKPASVHSSLEPAFYYRTFAGDTVTWLERALACCSELTAQQIVEENQECASLPLVAGMELSIPGRDVNLASRATLQPEGCQFGTQEPLTLNSLTLDSNTLNSTMLNSFGSASFSSEPFTLKINRVVIEEYQLVASEVPKIYH